MMHYADRPYKIAGELGARQSAYLPVIALLLAAALGSVSAFFGGELALILFLPVLPVMFVLRDMRVGALLLIFLLPFQHTPFLPQFTGFNLVNYLMLASLLSLLTGYYFRRLPLAPFPPIFLWAYFLPIGFATLNGLGHLHQVPRVLIELQSIYYSSPRYYLIGMVIKPMLMVLGAWMYGCAALQCKKPERLIGALLATPILPAFAIFIFVSINGFNLKLLADERSREVLGKLGLHANEFGLLLSTSFALMLFMMPTIRSYLWRFLNLAGMAVVLLALLLTFSRGGYVVAVVAILYFAMIYRQMNYIFLIALLLCATVAIAPDALWLRISNGINHVPVRGLIGTSNDGLTAGRVWMWNLLLPDVWRHPFVGTGVGATAWAQAVLRGEVSHVHPHNLYLRIVLDMGLIGLFLLACFVTYLLRNFKRIARMPTTPVYFVGLANGTRAALLGLLIAGWSNGDYIPTAELTVLWMAIGLLLPFMKQQVLVSEPKAEPVHGPEFTVEPGSACRSPSAAQHSAITATHGAAETPSASDDDTLAKNAVP